jgi:RNA polymerase sigma factor (sigma-70 family)
MQPRGTQDWIEELRGQRGAIKQRLAFIELERYLNRASYNFLRAKAPGLPKLASLDQTEWAQIAQECVHDVLAQLIQNNFAELEEYRGEASFLHYLATFAYNRVRRELKRMRNRREIPLPDYGLTDRATAQQIEQQALIQTVMAQLKACLEALPARMRQIFWLRRVEGISIQEVAVRLAVTPQIVKNDVARAEPRLRLCLEQAGYDQDILVAFE